jgi:guanosine-3',5'-bis(diphosphate) 3'-pyrophosphohydrolase
MTIEKIINLLKEKRPDVDTDLVVLAYEFAKEAHQGQKRSSGEDYIQHPLHATYKLVQMNLDIPTIVAGILHDVPEDTEKTLEDIKKNFGSEVAKLVEGITKLGKIKYRGMERYAENLRKMFVAMAEDIRVIFIKFADRIHNLKTLDALEPVKQQRVAKESLEIYAPIANRLGMEELKSELEDLSFPYVYPDEYKWVLENSKKKFSEQQKYADKVLKMVEKDLRESSDVKNVRVEGRAKRYYSLYQKLLRKEMDIDKIYDLVALRVIVEGVDECYKVLGHIHKMWKPLTGRIKDYIAQPKPNGYKSLHTTVFGPEGRIAEFQIRTEKMHEEAEWGIAAHWFYKERGDKKKIDLPKEKLKWIKELVNEKDKDEESHKFLKALKLDFFKNRIFVFTPKGDVIDLPENATPIDFAYHIHTDIGHKCNGAMVNDKMMTLQTPLKSGDVVRILTDKNKKGPTEDWLGFVKTHHARDKIKVFFNKQKKWDILKFFNK